MEEDLESYKKCSKCNVDKSISLFHKDKSIKSGYRASCKECLNKIKRDNRLDPLVKEREKKYVLSNRDTINCRNRQLRDKNKLNKKVFNENGIELITCKYCKCVKELLLFKTKFKCKECFNKLKNEYVQTNIESRKTISKRYNDSDKRKEKRKNNHKYRSLTDDLYRMSNTIRTSISRSFKNNYSKKSRTHEILGCSYEELKIYLESKFESWMTWDNKGLYNGELNYGWDIDHIIPLSSANSEDDLYRLNHFTNLQPLCSKVNRDIKKDRYEILK